MLNWSQFHKFYRDWGKECLFMYRDCVIFLVKRQDSVFICVQTGPTVAAFEALGSGMSLIY